MRVLDDCQLDNIVGGNVWVGLAVVAFIIFLSGVFEGITNPGRCNIE